MKSLSTCLAMTVCAIFGLSSPLHATPIPTTYLWTAGSGLMPDQVDARMALTDTAVPENPVLAGGRLTLSTSANAENMFYRQSGADITMPSQLRIEASLRVGPGQSTQTGPLAPRAHAAIVFSTADNVGNALFFDQDRIFLLVGNDNLGPVALVDTVSAFHDYRIVVDGIGAGADITVFQDDVLILSGDMFAGGIFTGAVPQVVFGDQTLAAFGSSEWTRFSFNAATGMVPEPGSLALFAVAIACAAGARRRTSRSQA